MVMSVLATGVIWLVWAAETTVLDVGHSIAVEMKEQANVAISLCDLDIGCEVLSVTSTIGSSMLFDSVSLYGA
jgi:hypothetical protein